MAQSGLTIKETSQTPSVVSGKTSFSVRLNWAGGDQVQIGIGHDDGSLLVTGTTAFDALVDFCTGEAWALVAGNLCIVRENESAYLLRVLNPRISIRFNAEEFGDSLNELGSQRPTANVGILC